MIMQCPRASLNPTLRLGRYVRARAAPARRSTAEPRRAGRRAASSPRSCAATRTRCRAGRRSGSPSRWPWRCGPACCWPTSPPAPWTSPFRPRSSTCCGAARRARHRRAVHLPRPGGGAGICADRVRHARGRGGRAGAGRPQSLRPPEHDVHAGADGRRAGLIARRRACEPAGLRGLASASATWTLSTASRWSVPAGPVGLGLIGESGSGKTTIGRRDRADAGRRRATVTFAGRDASGAGAAPS